MSTVAWASLSGLHRAAEARLLADRPWRVERSDLWTSPAPVVTAGEAVPLPVHDVDVPAGTDALSVGPATFETTGAAAAVEGYAVVVRDAGGAVVGRTRQHGATSLGPVSSVVLDLRGTSTAFGRWTLSVEGVVGVNDEFPSSFSDLVVHAALLEEK